MASSSYLHNHLHQSSLNFILLLFPFCLARQVHCFGETPTIIPYFLSTFASSLLELYLDFSGCLGEDNFFCFLHHFRFEVIEGKLYFFFGGFVVGPEEERGGMCSLLLFEFFLVFPEKGFNSGFLVDFPFDQDI